MKALLEKLSYGNVVATLALFIALGGVAWAVEGIGPEPDRKGSGGGKSAAGILGGEVDALPAGDGFTTFNPIGGLAAGAGNDAFVAPRTFIATGLRVEIRGNVGAGKRTVRLQLDGQNSGLKCTIRAPDRVCTSNKRVEVFKGTGVTFAETHKGVDAPDDALFGWVAAKP